MEAKRRAKQEKIALKKEELFRKMEELKAELAPKNARARARRLARPAMNLHSDATEFLCNLISKDLSRILATFVNLEASQGNPLALKFVELQKVEARYIAVLVNEMEILHPTKKMTFEEAQAYCKKHKLQLPRKSEL
jgi:hypothetical protein